jgi:FkbH-like protein
VTYSEILRANAELLPTLAGPQYPIRVLSNLVVTQINELLEYELRIRKIAAVVTNGDYDNVVQESAASSDYRLVVVMLELCNLVEGLQFEIDLLDEAGIEAVFQKTTAEINLVFENLKDRPLVLFNRFTALPFTSRNVDVGPFAALAGRLNGYLEERRPHNVRLVDVEKVMAHLGVSRSVDMRYFYSARALYSVEFLKQYVESILPYVMAVNGKLKKALILDCDGTLWKGVLGEDGEAGIEMGADTRTGAIFAEVQSIALAWNRRGVILGLCSKNNMADVDHVLDKHPQMRIRDEHLAIKRVNWEDKVTNLREIARELQIGLDSIVFVDDSAFEAEHVRAQLPEVEVLQVPRSLSAYPGMLRERAGWFFAGGAPTAAEDLAKTQMYKAQAARATAQAQFATVDDYLASLGIQITIAVDDAGALLRLAQLSQKTNQFNVTTIRYTESEVKTLIESDDATVLSLSVRDRFGDSGIVGLCIVRWLRSERSATIDSFLMSCRVIGRNIEYAVMDYVVEYLKREGALTLKARYAKTAKNDQVREFFDRCSFPLVSDDGSERVYSMQVDGYEYKRIPYLEMIDGSTSKESHVGGLRSAGREYSR